MKPVPNPSNHAIFAYFLIISLDSISFGLIAPILAPLLTHPSLFFPPHLSSFSHYVLYGSLIALFPLAYMISAPVLGIWSDRFGRKKVLMSCLIITLLAFIGYAFAFLYKSIGLLILARFFSGISAGSQGVAQAAVVDFSLQENRPQAISTIAIGMTMGLIIGPLAASAWSHSTMWAPFSVVILLTLIAIFVLNHLPNVSVATPSFYNRDWKNLFSNPKIMPLFLIFFLFECGWSLYFQSLPLWLSLNWHLENQTIGLISAYIGSALGLFLLLGMRLGLRFASIKTLISFSFLIGIISLIFMTAKISFILFLILTLPTVLSVALIYPGLISQLSLFFPNDRQGLLMGLTDTLMALAFTITGMLSSLLMYFHSELPFMIASLCWIAAGSLTYHHYKKNSLCTQE